MRLIDLALLYAVVGIGCAVFLARRAKPPSVVDAALTIALWPVYVPSLVAPPSPERDDDVTRLAAAIADVREPALRAVLPSRVELDRLRRAIEAADARAKELDRVLAQRDFDERLAEAELARAREVGGANEEDARRVLASIRRLAALRDRALRERDDLVALARRLRVQIAVLRFSGAAADDVSAAVRAVLERASAVEAALAEERDA